MSPGVVDTSVLGEPESVRATVAWLQTLIRRLARAESDLDTARRLTPGWEGHCANAFDRRADHAALALARHRASVEGLTTQLAAFADDLAAAQAGCRRARATARAAGLPVTAETIGPPVDPTPAAVTGWETARAEVTAARAVEERAHEWLRAAVQASTGEAAIADLLDSIEVSPTDVADGVDSALFAMTVATSAGKAGVDLVFGRPGSLDPRVPYTHTRLRYDLRGLTLGQRARVMAGRDGWRAPTHLAPDGTHTNALKLGRVLGPVGSTASAVGSGYDQWREDADDPRYSDAERAARASTVAAGTAGGGTAGSTVGAWTLGALGSFAGPGGTAAGIALGGLAGGWVGSKVGSWGGESAKGWVGDRAEDAERLAEEARDRAQRLGEDAREHAEELAEDAGVVIELLPEVAEAATAEIGERVTDEVLERIPSGTFLDRKE